MPYQFKSSLCNYFALEKYFESYIFPLNETENEKKSKQFLKSEITFSY